MREPSFLRVTALILAQRTLVIASMTTDTFFLSRVSDAAVSGVGLATTLMLSLITILNVIAMSGTSLLSFAYGKGRTKEAEEIFPIMVWISVAAALILMSVQLALAPRIGAWVGLDAASATACETYLVYMAPLFLLDAAFNSLSALLTASKRVRELTFASGSVLLTDLLLNASILSGWVPGLRLGVREIALASVASQIPALVLMALYVFRADGVRPGGFLHLGKDATAHARKILGIALPTSLDPISLQLSGLGILAMIGAYNSLAVAAFAYVKGVMIVFTSIGAGAVGVATQVFAGYRQGAGDHAAADSYMNRSLLAYAPIVFVASGALLLFSDRVFGLLTDDDHVLGFVSSLLAYMLLSETFRAMTMIIYPALRGLGNVRQVTALSMVSQWTGVAIAWFLGITMHMGLHGIMIGVLLDEACRAGLNLVFWKRRTAALRTREAAKPDSCIIAEQG